MSATERNVRVGAKIRRQRQVLGWNQRELAERVGVHVGSVQKWESGTFYPGRKLGKVEAVLGIELDDENGSPEEPELPPEMMKAVDEVTPEGHPKRQLLIETLRQALADTSAGVPAEAGPGRHRRRAAG